MCSSAKFVGTLEVVKHYNDTIEPEKEFIFDLELPATFSIGFQLTLPA